MRLHIDQFIENRFFCPLLDIVHTSNPGQLIRYFLFRFIIDFPVTIVAAAHISDVVHLF